MAILGTARAEYNHRTSIRRVVGLPTGTVTFLFTDIEKSTRLLGSDRATMRDALVRHHDLLRSAIEEHRGVVFETVGDAVYAAFASPTDAIEAAIASQRGLTGADWGSLDPIRARMAVHSGEVEQRDAQHYIGEALVRCARMLVLGHGGQTLVSGATSALVQDGLSAGATLRDLGEHRLRDLSRPERVFQLDAPGLSQRFPALLSLDARPNNLPIQLTSFIGREGELGEVTHLIREHRALTLTGAGGIGKTRLALETAEAMLDEFPDGVWLVELAPLSDGGLVWPTLGAVLGVRELPADPVRGGGGPVSTAIVEQLRTKQVLIVLDNCEHLIGAAALMADHLLRQCPRLRVLATSREGLGIAGERIWRVPSLAEAADLFVARARAIAPGFAPSGTDAVALKRICERLDGIPLAVELAAARTGVLSLQEIASRLDDRFRLLTGGSRTSTARQRTLRAAVDWSYSLLTGPEKTLWGRLSAFAGAFSLEAAEAICEYGTLERSSVLDLLASLTAKSLLVTESSGSNVRHRMLETLREYAGERSIASGETDDLRRRHAEFHVALAEREAEGLAAGGQAEALGRLEAVLDDLRAAIRWSTEHDIEKAVRLGVACARYLLIRGHLSDGLAWRDAVVPQLDHVEIRLRAHALTAAGWLSAARDDHAAANELHRRAHALFGEIGDRSGMAEALNALGALAARRGEDAASREFYEQSLAVAGAAASPDERATALHGLGRTALRGGDYPRAREHLKRVIRLRREMGDRMGLAHAVYDLGVVADSEGDPRHAEELMRESAALFRDLGAKVALAAALGSLGNVAAERGDDPAAQALLDEAERIGREAEAPFQVGMVFIFRAEIALGHGEVELADELVQQAAVTFRPLDSYRGITWCWELAARVAAARGQHERALTLLSATLETRHRIDLVEPPIVRERIERDVARLRDSLGSERAERLWSDGAALTPDAITALVLAKGPRAP